MCEKISYATNKLAKDASTGLSKRSRYSMRVYKCSECGGFHLMTCGKSKPKHDHFTQTRPKYPLKIEDIHYKVEGKKSKKKKRYS